MCAILIYFEEKPPFKWGDASGPTFLNNFVDLTTSDKEMAVKILPHLQSSGHIFPFCSFLSLSEIMKEEA